MQLHLGAGVALRRSAVEPDEGVLRIARHPLPAPVHHPEQALRPGVALPGQRPEQLDRGHIVAAVIGRHAVFPRTGEAGVAAYKLRNRDQAPQNGLPVHRPPPNLDSTQHGLTSRNPLRYRRISDTAAAMPDWGWRPARNWLVISSPSEACGER